MVSTIGPYLIALISVFCVFILRWLADPFLGDSYPFQFFFISVLVTVQLTRLAPSLLALFLGGFLGTFFFVEPRYSLVFVQPNYAVGFIIYFFVSSIIIYYVTQTKRQKKQLQEKSVWLQRLIHTSPDILFVLDVQEKKNTFISKEIQTYLGYQPEEILALDNQVLDKVIHPDDLPSLLQIYQRMDSLPDSAVSESLVRLRHADGTYRTFHTRRAVFSRGEDGRVKEITGTMRDITMLQEAEESLRKSEERYRLINRATHDVLWDWDLTTGRLEWNEAVETAFGYSREELGATIHGWYKHLHPDDRERVVAGVHAAIDEGTESWSDEYRFQCEDGSYAFVLDRGFIARDPAGKAYRMIGSMFDLTQLRKIEAARRQSDERLRFSLEACHIGAWDLDLVDQTAYRSLEHDRIFGYEERLSQWTLDDFLRHALPEHRAPVIAMVSEATAAKTGWTYECPIRRVDGEIRWIWFTGRHYTDLSGHDRVVGVVQDITERKRAEESLRESQMRYRTLFDSIDEGFCIIEVLFDENEKPIDYLYLEVNPAFEKHTGLVDAPGKRIREMVPKHEEHWFEIYGRIALTGQPVRFQNRAEELNRWYDVYAFQFGNPENRQVAVLFNDISERKQVEEELARLAQFPEENPNPVLRIARDGTLLYANPSGRRSVVESSNAPKLILPTALQQLVADAFHSSTPVTSEIVDIQGEIFLFTAVQPIGEYYVNLYGLNITDRKRTEEALQLSESRYRELVQNSNSAIVRWRKDGAITFFNEFAQSFFGYSAEEIIGQNAIILVPPQDSEGTDLTGLLQAIMDQPEHFINNINENICRDGRRVWMTWTNKPIFDENGQLAEVLAIGSDITDRKKMEEALRLSESFYRQTLESIPGMVFTTRPDGYCDYQSQQWVEYTGVPLSEHLGDGWNRLLHSDDRVRTSAAWQAAVEGRADYDLEYRVRRHDGEYEWFKVIGQPIRNEAGEIVRWFGVALNVEQLKQTEEILREADRRKDEFLAILGHELRNPLAAITTAIKLMNRPNQDAQKEWRFKSIIEEQSHQLNRILSDLLDVSRIARGKIKVEMQEVRVAEVVEKSLESIHKSCQDLGHRLSMDCPVDPLYVNGDPARLQQILVNLLNNACKYTPEGGQIHLAVEEEDETIVLRVVDNGIGIPPEAQPYIFDMFTQVESGRQKSQGGLGIGLSLAKMLVEMHGGTLSVFSEGAGKGSEFIVRLPKKYPALSPPKTPEPPHYEDVKGLQVLVVEDNPVLGQMLADTVKEHGHNVQYARDGMEAVLLAREQRPEVVLLDIGLPKLDGYEVARRLRNELELKKTLIVATTAWGQDRDRQRSVDAGIDHHLVKPVDYMQIAPLINRWHLQQLKANPPELDTTTGVAGLKNTYEASINDTHSSDLRL